MHSTNPKRIVESQQFKTKTVLRIIDFSKQSSESITVFETAYEPIRYPATRKSDLPLTIEMTDPTLKEVLQNLVNLEAVKTTQALILMQNNRIYLKIDV